MQRRVLVLVTDAYGGTGGIAQYCRDLVEAIAAYESVAAVTVVPRIISRTVEGIPPRVSQLAAASRSKLAYVRTILRISTPGSFELVVCGHINLLPLAYFAARRIKAPIILATYGAEVWNRKNLFVRHLVSRLDGIAAISRFTRDRMARWLPVDAVRFFVVPNAIELDDFREDTGVDPSIAEGFELNGSPVLLTLGRMDAAEKAKGFDEVLEVLPELLAEFPTLLYCLAGDGSDRPRLMAKAQQLGVASHVRFPGYIPDSQKAALFRAADVYVMPSRLEGFGYVFLEALASGLPVIGSTLDGSREAIRDGQWGTLVGPGDRNALVAAIRAAITNPRVPPRVELEYFSKLQFRQRTHAMLDSVLQRNSPDSVADAHL